ncbi:hypothetical protein AB0M12_05285 [Nocardia vinacea]|uniref:hypothetical protein n=1 Tax=Nocardia vinacea TaxID=96468 RepID=UPI0034219EDE
MVAAISVAALSAHGMGDQFEPAGLNRGITLEIPEAPEDIWWQFGVEVDLDGLGRT